MAASFLIRPHAMATDRKLSYKVPTTIITDKLISQEARRSKALEDQKRRRAQRVDSSRQLDLFSDLNLGPSDDEEGESEIVREGVASFACMVSSPNPPSLSEVSPLRSLLVPNDAGKTKKKGKKKKRPKAEGNNKPNKWADKCMYAELLEMRDGDVWDDGLPQDLENGWVAVAPVPVGKRCLAVTHQSSGVVGVVPNTSLRSRVLGKSLMLPFPSNLPPRTILDCILDPNWRDNGILHVLDVLQWKGQDVGDCETPFRFWWRDTRLAELPRSLPPSNSSGSSFSKVPQVASLTLSTGYQFPYPINFIPIPYFTNTTIPYLSSHVIPLARSLRLVSVDVPLSSEPGQESVTTMDVDDSLPPLQTLTSLAVELQSDGLLLYLSQASYEPGTSPLSSWIPITESNAGARDSDTMASSTQENRPLDLFERLVTQRLAHGPRFHEQLHAVNNINEVEMES